MGGAIAQHHALRHPNKVDRLILGCTFAGRNCSQSGDFTPLLNGNLAELLFTPDYIKDNQPSLQTFLDQNAPYRSTPPGLFRQLNAIATHDTCNLLPQITAPTLVITGDRDTAIPPSNSHFLAKTIPNAKLETIPDAAHGFSYSHAAETSQLIQSFLS